MTEATDRWLPRGASRRMSGHQQLVHSLMVRAKQSPGPQLSAPIMPPSVVRLLRARLQLEETLELIRALGFSLAVANDDGEPVLLDPATIQLKEVVAPSLKDIADGCLDTRVIATGTLVACGLADQPLQQEVDLNNLMKFGPGHTYDAYGKLVKPPGHKPPRIQQIIEMQSEDAEDGY